MSARLALGTAQFGLDYGIANTAGRVAPSVVADLLAAARRHGLDTLDTAIAYGDSETVLGQCGVQGWRVVSKLPPLPAGCRDVEGWVQAQVEASCARLGLAGLYGLLLHRPEQLLEASGPALAAALHRLKADRLVEKTGFSLYDPAALPALCARLSPDLVQAPFNPFDCRLVQSGWAARLRRAGVELHGRSVFLQGLLLLPAARRPAYFQRWQPVWERWERWLATHRLTPLTACLRHALGEPTLDRVIVGTDTLAQWQEIAAVTPAPLPDWPERPWPDPDLVTPSHWKPS